MYGLDSCSYNLVLHQSSWYDVTINPYAVWEQRAQRTRLFHDRVCRDTHCLLRVRFTPLGVAHYAVRCQGQEYKFCPTLFKKTYRGDTDWGVWHFLEDLPLNAYSSDGRPMIESDWHVW